jgi:tetraacyldisaccharide 4'-kinase
VSALERDWWHAGLTWRTAALLPLSWLFGALVRLRRCLHATGVMRVTRLPVPVVVVGNLVVGGSGKTPLVIGLLDALTASGRRPGVVSRGHGGAAGRKGATPAEVLPVSDPRDVGDEPLLIRRRADVPVFVGRDRVAAVRALLAAHPATDLVVCDDGLQHLALARDMEIAVFDRRGAGNARLLPAGPLREPLTRLEALDAVVANGGGVPVPHGYAMHLEQGDLYRLEDPECTCPIASLTARAGPRIAAVAGIGHPERFFDALGAAGLRASRHAFPDHHPFTRADLAAIAADAIVMTEKDAIKCAGLRDPRIWVAPASARIDRRLVEAILEKTRGPEAA